MLYVHVSVIIVLFYSVYQTGLFLVWRLEPGGQLHPTPVHHNQLSSKPTHCVLIGANRQSKGTVSQFSSQDSINCFIAVSSGSYSVQTLCIDITQCTCMCAFTMGEWVGLVSFFAGCFRHSFNFRISIVYTKDFTLKFCCH